ncbi:MAG: hypothetical protein A2520_03720 [Deltaproteobacteria bacterium RIFOXYD12_FULL_53_23]|nr:MAG: hypothetical protein A2520_03720 [Deltaproteobacteria bacterium RIFOXYD12_FULL_53_23]
MLLWRISTIVSNLEKAIGVITNKKAALVSVAFLFVICGCAFNDSFGGSRKNAVNWASDRGFTERSLTAGPFQLLALTRRRGENTETLTVYIEGDGAPWITPWHPPRDPTPRKPIALALAAADTAETVIYLGRPCQYQQADKLADCAPIWWIEQRFALEVLMAYDEVLTQLKSAFGAQRLRLVGYSGGGVIAALLAVRRTDVASLVTVAAPLSLNKWVAWHDLTPFAESTTDPVAEKGRFPPGVHWAGEKDSIVPPAIVEYFVKVKAGQTLFTLPGYDHECCWAQEWPSLLTKENAK